MIARHRPEAKTDEKIKQKTDFRFLVFGVDIFRLMAV